MSCSSESLAGATWADHVTSHHGKWHHVGNHAMLCKDENRWEYKHQAK